MEIDHPWEQGWWVVTKPLYQTLFKSNQWKLFAKWPICTSIDNLYLEYLSYMQHFVLVYIHMRLCTFFLTCFSPYKLRPVPLKLLRRYVFSIPVLNLNCSIIMISRKFIKLLSFVFLESQLLINCWWLLAWRKISAFQPSKWWSMKIFYNNLT